jgi:hypothetical protein
MICDKVVVGQRRRRRRRRRRGGGGGIRKKKQEPHTKMWGMNQNGGMLAGDNNPVMSGITEIRGPLQQAY